MVSTLSRSGGASKVAERGVSESFFQGHGRWKSTTAKDGYVKDNVSRLSVSKSLGLYPLVVRHFQAVTLSSSCGFHAISTLVLMLRQCAAETSKINLMQVYFSGICCMVKLK